MTKSLLEQSPNASLGKRLDIISWILTVVVMGVVSIRGKVALGAFDLGFLPAVNAVINTGVAILLVGALVAVKGKRYEFHAKLIQFAMALSVVFLLCYVTYHFTQEAVSYGGNLKGVYYVLLISHILLAAVSFPLILLSWSAAFTRRFARHRKLVKWAYPMWLYVAITGPLCFLMLRPYY